jgi:hypothetical protein
LNAPSGRQASESRRSNSGPGYSQEVLRAGQGWTTTPQAAPSRRDCGFSAAGRPKHPTRRDVRSPLAEERPDTGPNPSTVVATPSFAQFGPDPRVKISVAHLTGGVAHARLRARTRDP